MLTPNQSVNRRRALQQLGGGFGALALGAVINQAHAEKPSVFDTSNRPALSTPRANAVIQLFMHGGPSHVDLLDPKPELNKRHGETPPGEVTDDEKRTHYLLGTPFKFSKHGESGLEYYELLPGIAKHADDIAVVRSMFTEHRNHEHALWMAHTGLIVPGRPSLGSWAAYGLGTVNQNLPAYVALPDPNGYPIDGIRNWSSGWLPPVYQGTEFRSRGAPVLNISPSTPRHKSIDDGRISFLKKLNAKHKAERPGELELDARITNLELAARMQFAATDAMDINQESQNTLEMYGVGSTKSDSDARRCLMARRLVERGVRFVQIFMHNQPWDTHQENVANTTDCCAQTDTPVGALLTDLKQRGLLDSTIVTGGGEFGRTPGAELRGENVKKGSEGRDHHPYGFSVWMAGGGIKGGQAYGATDAFGYRSIENRTQTAEYHATILKLLGLDHESLTYHHNCRDEKLTDVYQANPIDQLIA
ncbi:MAG: DUF1501 domain-containing protein [Pirellulales bacterium]|nr:DUF1501 domain-containing protein [Pirellulales bacterium]